MQQLLCSHIQSTSVSYRTTDQTAENITGTGIGRKQLCFVTDQHHAGAQMVCQNTHRSGQFLIRIVFYAGSLFNVSDHRSKEISLVYISGTV